MERDSAEKWNRLLRRTQEGIKRSLNVEKVERIGCSNRKKSEINSFEIRMEKTPHPAIQFIEAR